VDTLIACPDNGCVFQRPGLPHVAKALFSIRPAIDDHVDRGIVMRRSIESLHQMNANVHQKTFTVLADAEKALAEEVVTLARSSIPLSDVLAHVYTPTVRGDAEQRVRVVLSTQHGMMLFGMQIAADPDKWLWVFRYVSKKLKTLGVSNIVPLSRSMLCKIEYEFYTTVEHPEVAL
jgi:hypothetical protein